MLQYFVTTLGCKVNQYDSRALTSTLEAEGLTAVRSSRSSRGADLLVVNTCCVTSTAMRKSRQAIRRAVRDAPDAAVLVVGCYGEYDARRISEMLAELNVPPHRMLVSGHHDDRLPERLRLLARSLKSTSATNPQCSQQTGVSRNEEYMSAFCSACPSDAGAGAKHIITRRKARVKGYSPGSEGLEPIEFYPGHQRAFVKVQDGCDAFCTYCIVPFTRPVVKSRDPEQIESECRRLVDSGHKEIVLSGVFLGAFGQTSTLRRRWTSRRRPLVDLVRRIARIDGLWKLRLSSLEPGDLTEELLALWTQLPRLAPHFHLPLQSGSASVLKRMNRQYTADQYLRTIDLLDSSLDRPAITTDIIVGFPGESDDDFAQTLAVVKQARFSKIHAFPFSAIEGAAAWGFRDESPPHQVVRDRLAEMSKLEGEIAREYRNQFVGQNMEGLVERGRRGDDNTRQAMTDRYLTVHFAPESGRKLTGKVVSLRIDAADDKGLTGTLLDDA